MKTAMGSGPAPFSKIGKRARDLLTKDYNYDQKFSLSIPSSTGMKLTANGMKKDQIFVGDISTQYKIGGTIVDVKVDTYSNVATKVTLTDLLPSTTAAISFSVPDNKSGKMVLTTQKLYVIKRRRLVLTCVHKTSLDLHRKTGKLHLQYFHPHAAINSSIGLNPTPVLEVAAAIGGKDIVLGGEACFDTVSSSFTKYNAGISFSKPDFSAALILTDKGQALKASYVHTVNPISGTEVAAEMTHRFSTFENSFSIGSSHRLDNLTLLKTRFTDNGKVALLTQREWRPKSLVTVSAEYDTKSSNATPKMGLAIALKP